MNLALWLWVALIFPAPAPPQVPAADPWEALQFLVGNWEGEGSGEPGHGRGSFSFRFDLEKHVLVRRNRADYPATKDRAAYSHEDLMVIYPEGVPSEFRAIYFDNEGHVIHYTTAISPDRKMVQFLSPPAPGAPRFRLTYIKLDEKSLRIQFEIAPPGKPEAFSTYLEAKARRLAGE